MVAKATSKALQVLEEAKKEKGEDLTLLEKINVAGPVYIPSVLIGLFLLFFALQTSYLMK